MQSLKLAIEHNCQILPRIDKEINSGGADGQIFSLKESSNQVIKLSVIYEHLVPVNQEFERISNVLEFLQQSCPAAYARVFEYKKLIISNRKTSFGIQPYVLYYYIMEKCFRISIDESKVFYTLLSHEDRGINKNFSDQKIKEILKGLSIGLDFDFKKILTFCKCVRESAINHNDIHPRNIMKDQFGSFKLIDFDRCYLIKNK